ncbi:MAG: urease accessory UreF family protein [Chloroflexota bacterium]|nr:urease accessory UreF family protein [Chloroflexota bacterium]
MDSAFPTGAFAHSGGLETYVQADSVRTARDLGALIAAKLDNAAHTDLIVIHCAISAYQTWDIDRITGLDSLCAASKSAKETREASEKIGRRMLASVLNVRPDSRLQAYRECVARGVCIGHHAVVHGLAFAALEVDPRSALIAYAYALAANQTAASLKLMSIGQTQAQAVLAACGAAISQSAESALARTLDDFGGFAPGLDIRAMQHEHLFQRLFIS